MNTRGWCGLDKCLMSLGCWKNSKSEISSGLREGDAEASCELLLLILGMLFTVVIFCSRLEEKGGIVEIGREERDR
jgi:hypothetical protein